MKDVLVSVVIPNYNNEKYLEICLDSVLKQTHKNIEIVIVDDASTDGSVALIGRYMQEHACICLIENEVNKGVSKSKHLAILESKGDYFTTLDSDDFFIAPRKIEKELAVVQAKGKSSIGFSNIVLVGEDGKPLNLKAIKNIKEGDILEGILTRKHMIPRDFMLTKQQYLDVGGFDGDVPIYEDWDLKIRLAKSNYFYYTGVDGVAYRRHGEGLSAAKSCEHVKWLKYIYAKNEHLIPEDNKDKCAKDFAKFIYKAFGSKVKEVFPVENFQNKTNSKPVLFVHAMFRSGSTYMFNKFRGNEECWAYYEPLHHDLERLTHKSLDMWRFDTDATSKMNHPSLEKPHFYEYGKVFRGQEKLPFFKSDYAYKEFVQVSLEGDLKKYIENLILSTPADKVPLFQFNRTSLRIKWFKSCFQDSLNVFLMRSPMGQFESYFQINKVTGNIFFAINLLITIRNNDTFKVDGLEDIQQRFFQDVHDMGIQQELAFCLKESEKVSKSKHYEIFMSIWVRSFFAAVKHADLVIDMDNMNKSPEYRLSIEEALGSYSNHLKVSFEDYNIKSYDSHVYNTKECKQAIDKVLAKFGSEYHALEKQKLYDYLAYTLEEKEKKSTVIVGGIYQRIKGLMRRAF